MRRRLQFVVAILALPALAGWMLAFLTRPRGAPRDPQPNLPAGISPLADYQATRDRTQPWKRGMPLPASLADAGLKSDAEVVHHRFMLDGGSQTFLLRDSTGRYLAFCMESGLRTSDRRSRLFLGVLDWTDPDGVEVPADSATERFLQTFMALN